MQKIPFQSLRKSKKVSRSMPPTPQPLLGRPLETVYVGGGNGRFWGRDVKRDVAIHLYIYLICPEIPAKTRQFLSYKHSVPLCRDDIMLSLQIVP